MQQVRIKLQNISKYYYSETAVTQALQGINLEFRMGEFVAITGESGSGKSTLLRIISGMDTFDDGELYVDGQPTFQYDEDDWEEYRRTKIGFVFQDYSLIGHYTAKENIVSALLIMGVPEKEAGDKAIHYLERVGLSAQRDQRASKLSSGQKQRLSIARALAKDTDIIVADEPTGNLDSETGAQIVKLLRDLSQDHLVIMVTHNYEQVEKYRGFQHDFHQGIILPVGDMPDGRSWTGFQSIREHQGYFIFFREYHPLQSYHVKTWLAPGTEIECVPLLGHGKAIKTIVDEKGTIEVFLPSMNDYVVYKYVIVQSQSQVEIK